MKMMKKFHVISVSILLALFTLFELGLCTRQHHNKIVRMKIGAVEETPNDVSKIESLARFAVQQHNNKENTLLEFSRVLKAKEQVVAGKIYYLTLEAVDAGKKKIYEAKIWVKPWMNFKQLQEFKLAHAIFPFRSSDLGVKQEGHKLGWHEVPIHDPNVKDAAKFYMKSLNMKVNCLCRYELLDIVRAEIKVIEDYVKFNLLLKVSMKNKEERLRVEVSKKLGGSYYLSM
ncbi:cysteine proteinase inhibitor 12-like protein [Trifolium pratense]|uniref:Cysteine proteinase inhibitor n=1 Tax=Trifolium pratense TaxID=57577 RepID=A0A2K3P878_TRIPR|nr:cysteine proteinase inhibitor 12-like protein [Trifolium pratense]